ncbi:alpha/beta hydrolase [Acetobacteraceae bacterium H6797]|nr:alpha/beta hydrolase [Acetobacteraceae bacterium H6797]
MVRLVPGHGRKLSYYDFGRTVAHACQADPRFSYCAYVPRSYDEDGTQEYPLLVIVHGTLRDNAEYREVFVELAERCQLILLAPLFPAGITAPGELNSYKFIRAGALRYDHVLLSIVGEMREKYRISGERFSLYGFSGGGHFAHRFLYAQPQALEAVSIGAPGIVTLLDDSYDYWVGTRDFAAHFGAPVDIAAMRRVAVQSVVGGADTDTWEIAVTPDSRLWMPGVEAMGANRIDRSAALSRSLEAQGIAVRRDIVPGVAHSNRDVAPVVENFFEEFYKKRQQPAVAAETETSA